ncbi:MAG: type II secretion system protein, partial [Candidatus Vogelbacteria bacterium]|nr:type II secretion system protein [Candidatus Vogelbacteria bacterium]
MWAKIVKKYIHRRKTTPFFSTGFTLIEIMVAVSIFVIVAFIVTSTLLVVLDANRRANAWRSIMENVNFAIDSMSYKIKFGREYVIMND